MGRTVADEHQDTPLMVRIVSKILTTECWHADARDKPAASENGHCQTQGSPGVFSSPYQPSLTFNITITSALPDRFHTHGVSVLQFHPTSPHRIVALEKRWLFVVLLSSIGYDLLHAAKSSLSRSPLLNVAELG